MLETGPDVNGRRRQMRIVFSETPPSVHGIVNGLSMKSESAGHFTTSG
jgi:hypothetical protein